MKFKTLAIAAAASAAFVGATPALAVTTFTSTFESANLSYGSWTVLPSIEGWSTSSGPGIEVQNHAAGDPHGGNHLVELDSYSNSSMSRVIAPGDYSLSVWYSPRPGVAQGSNGLELLIGGNSVASGTWDGTGLSNTSWQLFTYNFSTKTAVDMTFRAIGTSDSYGAYLDDISLTGTGVPEPGTWAMMIVGLGLAGAAMRRSRRQVRVAYA